MREKLRLMKMYWQRKLPTEAHKEKWRDFEKILNIRANCGLLIFVITNAQQFIQNNWQTTKSLKFLEGDKSEKIDS